MGHILFHPTISSLTVAGIAAFSFLIWFVLRRRFRRIWFPMIQILTTPPRKLPRFRLQKPPLTPFICFLVVSLCLIFLSFKPQRNIFVPLRPDEARIHILFDLSPSNSVFLSEAAYQEKASKLIEGLLGRANVTVSTTGSDSIFKISDIDSMKEFVSHLVYHRPGARLGSIFSMQSSKIGSLDQLIVFADSDRYSWEDFSWKHLQSQTDIYHLNIEQDRNQARQNISIGSALNIYGDSSSSEWEVELLRNYSGVSGSGVLKAWSSGVLLNTQNFQFKANERGVLLDVTLPLNQLKNQNRDLVIWTIETSDPDAMKLDNEFRSQLSGDHVRALLIGAAHSESLTSDPLQRLTVALEKSSTRVKRLETLSDGASLADSDLVILNFNEAESESITCDNINLRDMTVWLLPSGRSDREFKLMCECYVHILAEKTVPTSLCEDVSSRVGWVSLLSSIGAKQIGGSISSSEGSLAFEKSLATTGGRLVGFTFPLYPISGSPIHHGNFPVIIKHLVEHEFQSSKENSKSKLLKPIEEMSKHFTEGLSDSSVTLLVSNIPKGESRLESLSSSDLPPPLLINLNLNQERTLSRQQESDPKDIIRLMGVVIGLAMLFEILWWLWKMRLGVATLFLFFLVFSVSQSGYSQIQLTILGGNNHLTFQDLAKDIGGRTSIELDPTPEVVGQWDDGLLERPWLWAMGSQFLISKKSNSAEMLGRWLRKGGFIVIESEGANQNILEKALNIQPEVIPPDHELMRSFYLLDSLPACKGITWKAFQFDKRLIGVLVPAGTLESAADKHPSNDCSKANNQEKIRRAIINTLMVALATDYKRDQIHLPEILKRLR